MDEILRCLVCLFLGNYSCSDINPNILYLCPTWKYIDCSKGELGNNIYQLAIYGWIDYIFPSANPKIPHQELNKSIYQIKYFETIP